MADARLILLVATACRAADADEGAAAKTASGLTAPAGWRELPALASSARAAATAPGTSVDGVEAWGEPAMGCYAVWLALRGATGGGDDAARQVVDGLTTARFTLSESRTNGREVSVELERAPYRGALQVRVGDGALTALACVANERERPACAAACATLLGAAP
jgi:hypothetical protein